MENKLINNLCRMASELVTSDRLPKANAELLAQFDEEIQHNLLMLAQIMPHEDFAKHCRQINRIQARKNREGRNQNARRIRSSD